MGAALNYHAARSYRQVGTVTASFDASPHKLVEMLYTGALDHIASARGCLQRGETEMRLAHVGRALAILEHLRQTLDINAGGEMAKNLNKLYEYMCQRLAQANANADENALEEVLSLLRPIKAAWDAMPQASTRH